MLLGLVKVEIKRFILSRDIKWPHDQRVMWLWKTELLSQSQHCAKFDAYKTCGSRDIMFLFCHVTLCEHMIKVTCDLVSRSPFNLSQHYTKFYAFRSCGNKTEIKRFYFVMWHQLNIWSMLLCKKEPSTKVTLAPILMLIDLVEVKIQRFYFVTWYYVTTWS